MQSLSSRQCQSARMQFKGNQTRILSPLQCTRTKTRSANFRPQLHHNPTGEWTKPSIDNPTQPIHSRLCEPVTTRFCTMPRTLGRTSRRYTLPFLQRSLLSRLVPQQDQQKYPPNQKFMDEGTRKEQVHLSHHQAMLLYDNTLHQKNPFYDRQSFCNYPPDNCSSSALFANPQVIHPTFPPNLSPLHMQIFPNRSTQTYDKHVHDYPIGCETDLTLVFYHEHDTL